MDNKYSQRQEFLDNPGKKLPVIFLIDTSDSMNNCKGGTPTGETGFADGRSYMIVKGGSPSAMQNLRKKVEEFHNAIINDKKASIACQTSYLGFDDDVKVIENFGLAKNKKAPIDKLVTNNNKETHIVKGIKKALSMIDEQKKLIYDNGEDYYQPWLIILTDGIAHDSSDEIKNIKNELKNRQVNNKLVVYSLTLGDDPDLYEHIRGYSIYKPVPYDADGAKLSEFFTYLAKSISSISSGKIKGSVPGFTDPDDLSSLL